MNRGCSSISSGKRPGRAKKYGIGTYCQLPIDPDLATAVDAGEIEFVMEDGLDPIVEMLKEPLIK